MGKELLADVVHWGSITMTEMPVIPWLFFWCCFHVYVGIQIILKSYFLISYSIAKKKKV